MKPTIEKIKAIYYEMGESIFDNILIEDKPEEDFCNYVKSVLTEDELEEIRTEGYDIDDEFFGAIQLEAGITEVLDRYDILVDFFNKYPEHWNTVVQYFLRDSDYWREVVEALKNDEGE